MGFGKSHGLATRLISCTRAVSDTNREKKIEGIFEKLSDIEVFLSFPFSALNPLMFRGEDCKMLI